MRKTGSRKVLYSAFFEFFLPLHHLTKGNNQLIFIYLNLEALYSYFDNFMHNHKLIGLLKTLSRKEMTRFREFVHSPYFNKHKGVRQLISYLDLIFPKFDEKNCSKVTLIKKLFDQAPKDKNQLSLLFTYSLKLFDQFLSQEQFKNQATEQEVLLLQSLRSRTQFQRYDKVLQAAESRLSKCSFQDSTYYKHQYLIAKEADAYYLQNKKRRKDLSIQLKQNNLDKFYLAEKLKDACEMHIRKKILNIDYSNHLLPALVHEIQAKEERYSSEPSIYIYYKIYQMIVHEAHHYYFEALETLNGYLDYFPKIELNVIYNYFQNYCIEQINKGQQQFLAEIFKLYQSQLEQELLLEDGLLLEWHYKNIVTTGIRLKEMDWVRQFIEDYKDRLQAKSSENAYIYNMAAWYHAMKQYDKVLDLLIKVEYVDLRYSLGAKALLLRTYYELEEFESLFSLTDSFRQYLNRNELMADSRRQGYYNLARYTKRLAQIKANLGFTNPDKLQKEYQKLQTEATEAIIFNKSWLQDKLEELKI